MKQVYFLILSLFAITFAESQTVNVFYNLNATNTTVIGSGKNLASESIYTDAEIGSSNFITSGGAIQKVYFYLYVQGTGSSTVNSFNISMKNVPITTTSFTTGTYSTAGYTSVYSGTLNATPTGYVGVTLSTPFVRTPGTNLQVLIERKDNIFHNGYQFIESEGLFDDPTVFSSRLYNGNTIPASGTTTLTATVSRPGMRFVHTYVNDAVLRRIINPPTSCYDATQTIGVQIFNAGSSNISAGSASVTLKMTGANPFTGSAFNTTTIIPGGTETINFTDIDLSIPGDNEDTAYVNLTGENYRTNDTLVSFTSTASVLSSFPITEDAETLPLPVFGYAQTLSGTSQLWSLQADYYTNEDMNPAAAPASTWDTIKPRLTGNKFYVFDSYLGDAGSVSRLYSNCITIPAASPSNPSPVVTMSFWMTHDSLYSTSNDSLYVSVSANKGVTWTRILPGFRRTDITAAGPYWKQELINLTSYAGQTIQIGFEGVSEYGNVIGLDDINITASGLVPVSVLSLSANRNGKVNNLHWIAYNQENAGRFVVERSNDGRNFVNIGEVNASAAVHADEDYYFIDAAPQKGNNYYRIRMIGLDNSFKLSLVRTVENLGLSEMTIHPNPVAQKMKLVIESDNQETTQMIIIDASGRKVYQQTVSVQVGTNNIDVPVGRLSKGNYTVIVRLNNQPLVQRMIKL